MNKVEAKIELPELAEQIAHGLSKASLLDGRAFIRTPVLFPSGSTVVVVLHEEGAGRYRVSDLGQGLDEAETTGMAVAYRNQASDIANRAGITFDGRTFIVTEANRDQLIGAVMAVANGTSRALERALVRNEGRHQEAAVERLVGRLRRVFPSAEVDREVELRGASTHAWRVDALVRAGDSLAAFDLVTPHHASIAFATTKFHDISRLEPAPTRVAVVHRKISLGDLLAVVAQAARVVEDDASDSTFIRAAAIQRAA